LQLEFNALNVIDPATGLSEVICICYKSAIQVALHFENEWLARYPCPIHCIHDNGAEFMGAEFQHIPPCTGSRSGLRWWHKDVDLLDDIKTCDTFEQHIVE